MAVRFVLGRAGSGKTRWCVEGVLEELTHEERTSRAILLVPEQASFQMERALATRSIRGGFWRAEVLSFSRLARRLLNSIGDATEALTPAARRMALRAVAAALPEPLRAFGATPAAGFFEQLDGVIESLLRENVSVAALEQAAGQVGDAHTAARLRDIRVRGFHGSGIGDADRAGGRRGRPDHHTARRSRLCANGGGGGVGRQRPAGPLATAAAAWFV
jgi:ATP-dependent helicase/nuclease subunit B